MSQTWDLNPIHDAGNVGSDVVGLFVGSPGDPGIGGLAGSHALRAGDEGRVEALDRFHDPGAGGSGAARDAYARRGPRRARETWNGWQLR